MGTRQEQGKGGNVKQLAKETMFYVDKNTGPSPDWVGHLYNGQGPRKTEEGNKGAAVGKSKSINLLILRPLQQQQNV